MSTRTTTKGTPRKKKLTRKIVLAKFAELGAHADEYAEKLGELGIVGVPGDDELCPLAVWAKKTFAEFLDAEDEVSIASWIVIDGVTLIREQRDVPAAAWVFMVRFDDGAYEELEDKTHMEDDD